MVKAINYRLNVFGFLGGEAIRSKDPHGSTGNAGLLDQRAAMAWVQRSIIAFGGDPSRITIDGCSAGAGSTANHFVSANSWPYFAQAAGESGMFAPWNSKPLALATNIYDELLVATGCTTLACLSNKSAYAIYKASAVAEGKATVQGTSAHTSGKLTRACLIYRLNVRWGGTQLCEVYFCVCFCTNFERRAAWGDPHSHSDMPLDPRACDAALCSRGILSLR